MQMRERIKTIMYECGIDDEWKDVDSLKYIQFLACIEEEFSIELPSAFFQRESPSDTNNFILLVEEAIGKGNVSYSD